MWKIVFHITYLDNKNTGTSVIQASQNRTRYRSEVYQCLWIFLWQHSHRESPESGLIVAGVSVDDVRRYRLTAGNVEVETDNTNSTH